MEVWFYPHGKNSPTEFRNSVFSSQLAGTGSVPSEAAAGRDAAGGSRQELCAAAAQCPAWDVVSPAAAPPGDRLRVRCRQET